MKFIAAIGGPMDWQTILETDGGYPAGTFDGVAALIGKVLLAVVAVIALIVFALW